MIKAPGQPCLLLEEAAPEEEQEGTCRIPLMRRERAASGVFVSDSAMMACVMPGVGLSIRGDKACNGSTRRGGRVSSTA